MFAWNFGKQTPFPKQEIRGKQFSHGGKFPSSIHAKWSTDPLGLGECIMPDPPTCYLRLPSAVPETIGGRQSVSSEHKPRREVMRFTHGFTIALHVFVHPPKKKWVRSQPKTPEKGMSIIEPNHQVAGDIDISLVFRRGTYILHIWSYLRDGLWFFTDFWWGGDVSLNLKTHSSWWCKTL